MTSRPMSVSDHRRSDFGSTRDSPAADCSQPPFRTLPPFADTMSRTSSLVTWGSRPSV